MAADRTNAQRLNALRLKLMQEVLPVGLAVADRARKGGAKDVIAAFQGDVDPIEQLRQEGEVAASQVRERLDRLSPGLGNPVVKVEVRDVAQDGMGEGLDGGFGAAIGANGPGGSQASADLHDLEQGLSRIAERLQLLEQRLGAG